MGYRILAINPGSTSTKTAFFDDDRLLARETLSHSTAELGRFDRVAEQYAMREACVRGFLERQKLEPGDLDAVVARGGLLRPIPGGTYAVGEHMLAELREAQRGEHACNLGALIAAAIAAPVGIPALIVDPVVVDELAPEARLSGLAEMPRTSVFHALNHKAVARRVAKELGKSYAACKLVVAHLGGGISVGAHLEGRVVDVNQALDGEGPFAPERSGTLPAWPLVQWALGHAEEGAVALRRKICGAGGMVSYLGTNDLREAWRRADGGDDEARLVIAAMAWQIAREIGACATVLEGRVDAVVLTGGLAHDDRLVQLIEKRVGWIAPLVRAPGEAELEALAAGALRVLRNEERARAYPP